MKNAIVTAVSHYAPDKVLDNSFFESYLETNDAWIVERTGIKERRILEEGPTSVLAIEAARRLLDQRGISADEIDLIIVATVTPDMLFPNTSSAVQHAIGAKNCWGFDLNGACSAFIFAIATGAQFVQTGKHQKVMVIGADKMSSITDYTDRNTSILFGDGAAAVLLEPCDDPTLGLLDWKYHLDGVGRDFLYMKGGGSYHPPSHETVDNKEHFIYQDGKAVFKVAVKGMADISKEIMDRNHLSADDVAYLVPHQANMRIIQATADRMGVDISKVMVNIDRYGNTTAATIPSCLAEYHAAGKLKKGDNLILAAFGAGYTWGGALLRWAMD